MGVSNVSNHYFIVDATDPSKFKYGQVTSSPAVFSDYSLCTYSFNFNFDITITAKAKVKLIITITDGTNFWDESCELNAGESITTTRHVASASGVNQGTVVEAIAL